jgi:Flp pilus assembly protein TadG
MRTNVVAPRRAARSHRSRGQALVEFAIVAPIFFVLLFAIIEAGRFILFYETLNNATREGARYAIVNGANSLTCPTGPPAPKSVACDPTGAHVVARVKAAAFNVMGTGVAVAPSWHQSDAVTPGDNGRGMTITVVATYTYHSLVPLVPLPPITITAESSLVINN